MIESSSREGTKRCAVQVTLVLVPGLNERCELCHEVFRAPDSGQENARSSLD